MWRHRVRRVRASCRRGPTDGRTHRPLERERESADPPSRRHAAVATYPGCRAPRPGRTIASRRHALMISIATRSRGPMPLDDIDTIADYLGRFGRTLAVRVANKYPPLYDPPTEP